MHQTLAITWNVNEQRPDHSSLFRMIRERAQDTHTLMVALQEVEMGGSSVALAAAKDAMAKGLQAGSLNPARVWHVVLYDFTLYTFHTSTCVGRSEGQDQPEGDASKLR